MRALLLLGLAACGARAAASTPIPDPPAIALGSLPPKWDAGEQTTWQVFYRNVAVGRVGLVVDGDTARTSFRTGLLASVLQPMSYDLVTRVDHGHPRSMSETLVVDGARNATDATIEGAKLTIGERTQLVPGGTDLHTLHSALGVVRAWATRGAQPGYLWLLHQGGLYRLDVFAPARDEALGLRALRVDGIVRALSGEPPIAVHLWLAANRDRTPLRFEIDAGSTRVLAEVVESTAAFD
ncbi:MAG TPA: hypothetical protein VFQ53_16465 [Kofleriaceae bacterium]|nr:hypothetical protein [Kofleriaceae bacterium]